jgi:hypothetical protein
MHCPPVQFADDAHVFNACFYQDVCYRLAGFSQGQGISDAASSHLYVSSMQDRLLNGEITIEQSPQFGPLAVYR